MRFLLVEDEDDIRGAAAALIHARGGEVIEAADGREALRKFRGELAAGRPVDVALLDFYIPHYRGDVVAQGLKHFAEEAGVAPPRMIALTGSDDSQMFGRFRDAGVKVFVAKGGSWAELEEVLFGQRAAA